MGTGLSHCGGRRGSREADQLGRGLDRPQSLQAADDALVGYAPPSASPHLTKRTGAHQQCKDRRFRLNWLPDPCNRTCAHRLLDVGAACPLWTSSGAAAGQGADSYPEEIRRDSHGRTTQGCCGCFLDSACPGEEGGREGNGRSTARSRVPGIGRPERCGESRWRRSGPIAPGSDNVKQAIGETEVGTKTETAPGAASRSSQPDD